MKFKESDWRASAFLLFSCTPARQMSPAQFRVSVSNGTCLVETQGLSVPNCYQIKPSCGNAAKATNFHTFTNKL